MFPTGQQTIKGLGREGERAAIRSATRTVLSGAETVKVMIRASKFSSSLKALR
jgi:hypothetical protein